MAILKDESIQLREIARQLRLTACCSEDLLGRVVTGGYAGDLMSDVIAHSKSGDVWVTMQVHTNTVAVAVQKGLAAIIVSHGREPEADTVRMAAEHNVALLVSGLPTFATVAGLARLGIS
ncbi:MAG: DRTGG domain-containing protein [Ignavibacteriales bacterium]|nr:DRTGG domain-containing protein [Ignavibacteriales bacterium]